MKTVDLRSDTITHPTNDMRKAMAQAKVGDDVFGEDPTVKKLEELAAEMLKKQDALFVASGTMGNLVSQLSHCDRGDEMILGDKAHIFFYEQGAAAAVGGIHPRTVTNQKDGTLALDDIESAIRPDNVHFPRSRLIALENTHNLCNGSPLSADYISEVAKIATKNNLKIHLDGARLFNAASALSVEVWKLAENVDSVSICLSKGLGAPVGSVVCGKKNFIEKARRARKMLGGGMRQAGVLASAGIIALTLMPQRLAEDHENARYLSRGLAEIDHRMIDPNDCRTNIIYFHLPEEDRTAQELEKKLHSEGVKVLSLDRKTLRAVTHYHIQREDIEYALKIFKKVLK